MNGIQEHLFDHRERLFDRLTDELVKQLKTDVAQQGQASLVVSGGSTPKPLFTRLATRGLPWHKIHVTLADERWVDEKHPRSNARLVRETLLTGKAKAANFISLYTGHHTPYDGEEACAQALQALPRPFSAVLLGMGDDGHTASLFPHGDSLNLALEKTAPPCLAMNAFGADEPRITLTLPVLCDTRQLVLLCTGENKRAVFNRARREGPVIEMPVRAFFRPPAPQLHFYWAP